jgi:hypothetical protein
MRKDLEELDLDVLDTITGGSAPLPMGLGGSSPQQHPVTAAATTTVIPGVAAPTGTNVGYTDHFGLTFADAGAASAHTSDPTSGHGSGPMGMGGSSPSDSSGSAGATDGHHDGSGNGTGDHNGDGHGHHANVGAQSAFDLVDQTANAIDATIAHFAGPMGLGQTS